MNIKSFNISSDSISLTFHCIKSNPVIGKYFDLRTGNFQILCARIFNHTFRTGIGQDFNRSDFTTFLRFPPYNRSYRQFEREDAHQKG